MDCARCNGPYWKIPPAPGTNQIAGFVELCPLTSWKKDKNFNFLSLPNVSIFFYSGALATRRAPKPSPIIIGTGSHACIEIEKNIYYSSPQPYGQPLWVQFLHRNRNPCNSFLMVKMANVIDHGRVAPTTTTTTTNHLAQHGGHPANTKSFSLALQRISLILDIHMMFNWQLSY